MLLLLLIQKQLGYLLFTARHHFMELQVLDVFQKPIEEVSNCRQH